MDIHRLHQNGSEVLIARTGAELQAFRTGGVDLLWNAGPLWPRHAPLLFPIVGGLKQDTLRHRGEGFPMPRHGFARNRDFTWTLRTATACTLELRDDAATRAAYPFPFRLTVAYALEGSGLRMDLALHNPADAPLPASLGWHPAFRWPLAPGIPKAAHRLVFEADEPGPLRRLDPRGLLTPDPHPTPIRGRELALREELFTEDALIFLEPRSRGLRFEAEGGPALTLRWEGFPHLGLWTRPDPGPSFLCIEPWEGHASPADWEGEFGEKPGSFLLPAGATRRWALTMNVRI
ncbi:MAG: aldose 1-epimerase family protein [Geothrix sp.]|nr:aldose 1-epimerase family protein [Geothrix sp.]